MTSFIQTAHEFIGDLLSRQIHYQVPEHQRDYSWTEDEVSQFWDDIWQEMENNRDSNEHFLGPIVVRQLESGRAYEIIDGQQRLTTSLILLAAIRNAYHEHGDNLCQTLQSTYFGHIDRRTRETVPKFTMNSVNDETFRSFIAEIKPRRAFEEKEKNRRTKLSNKRILQAYIYLKEKIDEVTGIGEIFNSSPLADLEEFIKEKLSAIQIVVSDEADAYTLFETLNERGIELSILDLLKNHLFKEAKNSRETVKQRWYETLANLDETVGTKFIRHYWISKFGRVQAGRLYRAIRDSARTRIEVMRLSEDLLNNSRLYSALTISDHELWDEYGQKVRDDIATLKLLNASQCLPVLMAAYHKFAPEHFQKTLRLMVIMAVRYSLICAYRTGALEINYADLAHKISSGIMKKAADARRALSDIYPKDDEFREAFSNREIKTAKHARFLLRELEVYDLDGAIGPVNDPTAVNLEHVVPKQKNQHWRNIGNLDGESYNWWVFRLGNQVLLEKNTNKDLGGASFEEKREALRLSQVKLSKDISKYNQWTTQEIAERQTRLADLAVSLWHYDVD